VKTKEERWWGKGDCEEDCEFKVGWEKGRVNAQEWLWVAWHTHELCSVTTVSTSFFTLPYFPLDNVGTEDIPFFFCRVVKQFRWRKLCKCHV